MRQPVKGKPVESQGRKAKELKTCPYWTVRVVRLPAYFISFFKNMKDGGFFYGNNNGHFTKGERRIFMGRNNKMNNLIHGTWKRLLSLVLVFALVITMVPSFALTASASEVSVNSVSVYDMKVNEINGYIDRVKILIGTEVPAGGMYSQDEYDNAIGDFIESAERDLYIAGVLKSGEIQNDGYVSEWMDPLKRLKNEYSKTDKEKNAVTFFNEGGYTFTGLGRFVYKSSFHKDYSSGLFGVLANKADAVAKMRDTVAFLEQGNKYMTSAELAEYNYNQTLNKLIAIKDDPSEIVNAVLEDDQDLKLLIGDLNIIVGSLDDIIDALDKLNKLGIGKDIMDPILGQMGLSYDMLNSIVEVKDILNRLNIDTSGDVSIEESLGNVVGGLVGIAVDTAVASAKVAAALKTEAAYNAGLYILNETYTGLKNNAANSLKTLFEPVAKIVEPMRPYLNMLGSSISLVNRLVTIVDQVNELSDDFTMGGLSDTTYTLAYILDDMADLMTAFGDVRIAELLNKLLENADLGGSAADATAGLLNQIINQLAGQDAGISGDDLGFIRELVDTLKKDGLKNTAKLIPLLRTSSGILKRIAELEGGIQDIIDKDYESAWNALTKDFGSIFGHTVDLWNDIIGLFTEPVTGVTAVMSASAGELRLDGTEGDMFLQTFAQGINAEATDTLSILFSSSHSYSEKYKRFEEFKEFTENVKEFVKSLEEINKEIKDACKWAEDNLSKEEAKDFLQKLGKHYAKHMLDIIKAGFNRDSVKNIISQMETAAAEIKDLICLIKQNGDIKIIATPGNDEVFYNLSTNYDVLREKLDDLFKELGISTEFALDSGLFLMDGIDVKAAVELEDDIYEVKASYRLKLYLCSREIKITLAEKMLYIEVNGGGEVPDPELTGIRIDKEPKTEYKINETLNLDGLEVYAVYDRGQEAKLASEQYTVDPEAGTPLTAKGTYTVTVSYKGFDAAFEITVNDEGVEEPDPVITDIKVRQVPNKIAYMAGQKLELEGLRVFAIYNDNSEDEMNTDEYTVEPSEGTELTNEGTITVTVRYKELSELSDSFNITVKSADTEEPEKENYTVTFNANGGALADGAEARVTVTSGTAIRLPSVTVRTNYRFNGWFDLDVHEGNAGDTYIVLSDVELIARWTYVEPERPEQGGGNTSGGGRPQQIVEIPEPEIPLAGIYSLLSLDTEFEDGVVYYIDDNGNTIFVPFCFTIGNKVYFLGTAGIDYFVKENKKQFGDIEGHWAHDNILAIASREVFQGYPDNSFGPDQQMTRAMLATVLARMAIADTSIYTAQVFDDVSMDTWYGPSVAWAFDKGIVRGVGNDSFNPDGLVTREEIAVMLSRFLKYTEIEMKTETAADFDDLNLANTWAVEAIDELQEYGIVTGRSGNMFDPFAETTRGEISTMLYRLIKIAINSSIN